MLARGLAFLNQVCISLIGKARRDCSRRPVTVLAFDLILDLWGGLPQCQGEGGVCQDCPGISPDKAVAAYNEVKDVAEEFY